MAPREARAEDESTPDGQTRVRGKKRTPRLVLAERISPVDEPASHPEETTDDEMLPWEGAPSSEDALLAREAESDAMSPSEASASLAPRAAKRRLHTTRIARKGQGKGKRKPSEEAATSKQPAAYPPLSRELLGIVSLGLGLLTGFALLSYDRTDPGFGVRGSGKVQNWIGPVGAYLADGLTLLCGIAAYGVPLAALIFGGLCFRRTFLRPRLGQWGGAALSLFGMVILLDVVWGRSTFLPYPAGGLVGAIVAGHLVPYLFPLGTGILALLAASIGIALVANQPPGAVLRYVAAKGQQTFLQARESLAVWQEHRRLLDEDRARLEAEYAQEQAERREAAAQADSERRERVADRAEQRAKRAIAEGQRAARDEAPRRPSNPDLEAVCAVDEDAILAEADIDNELPDLALPQILTQDPPWATGHDTEPEGPGVFDLAIDEERGAPKVTLRFSSPVDAVEAEPAQSEVLPRAVKTNKPGAANEDNLVIVQREEDDAQQKVADAEIEAEQLAKTFELPPLKLLDYDAPERTPVDAEKLHAEAQKLVQKFQDFGIEGRVREVRPGPVCTTFEFVPAPGIKVSRIAALADDIAMAMEAIHVRIVAPIPGKGAVGIEIPNEKRETVYLKEVIADPSFRKKEHKLVMALGKDIEGRPYSANLAEMPHVLISGTTGSGKSVSVNAMICSILYRATPDDVKFLMIDPKMLELSIYDGIPHLLLPPIVDSKKAAIALKWAVDEMERRYQAMSDLGVRDIEGFNARIEKAKAGETQDRPLPKKPDGTAYTKYPFIVVVVDEYADLLAVAGKDVEGYVMRLAQKARAAGIHVMLATQRPSVDVITGVIKANFPVRMGFRLASSHDSKTIVNRPGAEKLLGRGDMLIMPPGTSNLTRVHGAFISEHELHRVVDYLKGQRKPQYDMDILKPSEDEAGEGGEFSDERDEKFDDALRVVAKSRKCSTSWLQRQLGIGYNRAARIVEMMERQGLVGPTMNAKGDREIYIQPDDAD